MVVLMGGDCCQHSKATHHEPQIHEAEQQARRDLPGGEGQQPKAAIAAGLAPDALHAIAQQFGLSSVVLDDLAPEGLAKQLTIAGIRRDVEPRLPDVGIEDGRDAGSLGSGAG